MLRGRLAPSPTGALHLGNARSFLLAWLSIRSRGGEIVLRIEDLDHPKVKPEYASQLLDDLRWLGLDWDGEPVVQSQRKRLYTEALDRLRSKNLVYPCVCSRKDVDSAASAPHAEDEHERAYPGTCRDRFSTYPDAVAHLNPRHGRHASAWQSADTETPVRLPAWRFRTTGEAVDFTDLFCGACSSTPTDFVLSRSEDGAGYALAVVVDDAAMGVTEVLRGDDLLPATPRQILLYRALGLPQPDFVHVPLVVAEDGRRLAKRHGDTRLSALRAMGIASEAVTGLLAHWCGWADFGAHLHPRDLLSRFSLQTLNPRPAVLDEKARRLLRIDV